MDLAEINSLNAKREEFVVVMNSIYFNFLIDHQNYMYMFQNDTNAVGIPPPQISPIVSPIQSQSVVPQWILNAFGLISLFFILFVIITQR
jgi:hypothetical protein